MTRVPGQGLSPKGYFCLHESMKCRFVQRLQGIKNTGKSGPESTGMLPEDPGFWAG